MAFTTSTLNSLLNAMFKNTSFTGGATLYVGFSSTTPTDAGGNITEPSGNGYARVAVPIASWNSAASASTSNSAVIKSPTATGAWPTVTHAFVATDPTATGTAIILTSQLATPITIASGGYINFDPGTANAMFS